MTKAAIAHSALTGADAGRALSEVITAQLGDLPVHALIVFATPDQDHAALVAALRAGCAPETLVGCSSAGEFTSDAVGTGMTCAVALHAPEMKFTASLGHGLRLKRREAADALVRGFTGLEDSSYQFRSALVLTDALAGFADDLVDQLTMLTAGVYRFFGGGAGDDALFTHTVVFCDGEIASDAAVALEMLSNKPIGIGVRHGWTPEGSPMRVTESDGMRLMSLNAVPAAEAFIAHASNTGQVLDPAAPIPFFLHNVIGLQAEEGYRLRVPLGIEANGAVACAADVPEGSTACIMTTTPEEAAAAAAQATADAISQIGDNQPAVALFFDCVATRLRLGKSFDVELDAVRSALGNAPFAGFNTYGQIARAEGQFSGFHNCTAVVCVIPS